MEVQLQKGYILTTKDSIEAEHLAKTSSPELYANLIVTIVFLILLLLSVYRIKDPGFFIYNEEAKLLRYAQSNSDRIQEIIWYLIAVIFFWGSTFPRYDILTRWRESRKFKQNFVSRETKSISIAEDGLIIESDNFRESRKWHGFDKVLENKQIFLLLHSRKIESIIIPKRIFASEAELNAVRELAGIIEA